MISNASGLGFGQHHISFTLLHDEYAETATLNCRKAAISHRLVVVICLIAKQNFIDCLLRLMNGLLNFVLFIGRSVEMERHLWFIGVFW
jgi:hypothetical protein